MFPPNRSTADWPAHINGTSTTTNASDNVDRDNHPSPGIQKVTPVKYMSANSPGSSGLPVEGSRVPRKSPRDDRPAQEAQKTTQIKQKITFVRINTPNNPPGSGVGSYTPAKHQLANTPGSSNPPVQFSPTRVRGPSVNLHPEILSQPLTDIIIS